MRTQVREGAVRSSQPADRQGVIMLLSVFLLVVMLAVVAFAIDLGRVVLARSQLQNSADAAAMAAAWRLLDDRRIINEYQIALDARLVATQYAAFNRVLEYGPAVELNLLNDMEGDVVFGRFEGPGIFTTLGSSQDYNAALVRVKRTNDRNGEIDLTFARLLGIDTAGVSAKAIATFRDGIVGFRPTEDTGNSSLIPFTVYINDWQVTLGGVGQDSWTYNPATNAIESGSDGIPELKLFTGNQNTAGNFAALEIGPPEYGNEEIQRQTREGVSQADLEYFGGELKLDPATGTVEIAGDTGLTTGHTRAATDIIGKAVTLPLYESVSGVGNTSIYSIVGFAGARVVATNETGNDKYILVQPAIVVDDSAVSGPGQPSDNVYQPVVLVE